jgi:hypothetical protein
MTGHAPEYSQFQEYLMGLISTKNITEDTSWLAAIGQDDRDINITAPDTRSDTDTTVCRFPFTDISMCYDGSQFTINEHRLPVDKDDRSYPLITASTIRRLRYRHLQFISMWGGPRDYNGYGDRVQFNYFFDISMPQPVQDIYTNYDGSIYHPLLYGDINGDTLLDRVVFDGVLYPFCEDTCEVTIAAQTYSNRRWQPLKDNNGKPIMIIVQIDGMTDSVRKVLFNNWTGISSMR